MNNLKPSKSERKREQLALQALGEKLIRLTLPELDSMHLDDALWQAVVDAKGMHSHGALRRQRQLIGKLMRNANGMEIEAALEVLERQDRLDKNTFHAIEDWRDRICAGGPAACAEFTAFTGHDNSRLESLLRMLDNAANESGKRAVRRRIFREIHDELTKTHEHSQNADQE